MSTEQHRKARNLIRKTRDERVLRAVDAGMPRAEIVKTFAISPATIKRYLGASP